MSIGQVVNDPKTAVIVSTSTVLTGIGNWLEQIPQVALGNLGVIIGGILSIVLIYTHIGRYIREGKEMERQRKIQEARAQERKDLGLPMRRSDDL